MLLLKHGYKRQYVYGGSGLFNTVGQFLSKLFTGETVKKLGSTAKQIIKHSTSDLAKNITTAGKEATIQASKMALDKGLDQGLKKIHSKLTPKAQAQILKYTGIKKEQITPATVKSKLNSYANKSYKRLTPENKAFLDKLVRTNNINNMIDGSGYDKKAITIQDLTREIMNGSGLKII